ncbi:phospholipase D-like domain-containing protein [Vulcanisaeta souniana]|uniref:phospholipase D-like domain-containing protein n=1 Tax=Vulcanisaeta souniana TaxID=164452 RepID=UPI000A5782F3|nr:phospholipase D-like domain-containing protein [Vulcanisaeta souniana]
MVNNLTAKAMVVGGNYVYVGSVNLDYTSLHSNRELGIIIENPQVAQEVITVIQQWYGESKLQNQQVIHQTNYSSAQALLLLILLVLIIYMLRYSRRPKRRKGMPRL